MNKYILRRFTGHEATVCLNSGATVVGQIGTDSLGDGALDVRTDPNHPDLAGVTYVDADDVSAIREKNGQAVAGASDLTQFRPLEAVA